jgi:hypothetical protein
MYLLTPSQKTIQKLKAISAINNQESVARKPKNPILVDALQRKILLMDLRRRYLPITKLTLIFFVLIIGFLCAGLIICFKIQKTPNPINSNSFTMIVNSK